MKPNHLLVCVLSALLPGICVAAGDTVPCPEKRAGQWYQFTRTDLYKKRTDELTRVERVEGDRLLGTQDGQTLVTDTMHNWQQLGERTATPKFYRYIECPFSLGETRIYRDVEYDGDPARKPRFGWSDKWKAQGTFTVTVSPSFESLTVKAGTFRVVKVVSDHTYRAKFVGLADQRFGTWTGTVRVVSYFAPEIGTWVQSESIEKVDNGRYLDVLELIGYSRSE